MWTKVFSKLNVSANVGFWIMRITGLTLIGLGGHCLLQQARYQEFAETIDGIHNAERIEFDDARTGKTFIITATDVEDL